MNVFTLMQKLPNDEILTEIGAPSLNKCGKLFSELVNTRNFFMCKQIYLKSKRHQGYRSTMICYGYTLSSAHTRGDLLRYKVSCNRYHRVWGGCNEAVAVSGGVDAMFQYPADCGVWRHHATDTDTSFNVNGTVSQRLRLFSQICDAELFCTEYRSVSNDNDYANKHMRNDAYAELLEFCKEKYSTATKNFVLKKIHGLRCSFRRELKMVLDSQRKTGSSADDVYVPNLWYYELLSFIANSETPRQGKSSLSKDTRTTSIENQIARRTTPFSRNNFSRFYVVSVNVCSPDVQDDDASVMEESAIQDAQSEESRPSSALSHEVSRSSYQQPRLPELPYL
ncbi:hypothetical protein J6590_084011 [Homalodisca vitripennis]|nr:hypothetical protein J6590_084011 [Homalodisca vitripennis]